MWRCVQACKQAASVSTFQHIKPLAWPRYKHANGSNMMLFTQHQFNFKEQLTQSLHPHSIPHPPPGRHRKHVFFSSPPPLLCPPVLCHVPPVLLLCAKLLRFIPVYFYFWMRLLSTFSESHTECLPRDNNSECLDTSLPVLIYPVNVLERDTERAQEREREREREERERTAGKRQHRGNHSSIRI